MPPKKKKSYKRVPTVAKKVNVNFKTKTGKKVSFKATQIVKKKSTRSRRK
jgi:hypothetical protein